ncbi:MAG: malate dehydrogenase, partial [Nitrospirae bacterium]
MGRPKITIVGAGQVGGAVAHRLVENNCYEVVLVDAVDGLPQGKALDLSQAGPVCGYDARIRGTNRYDETVDSSVVVIVAGIARKPGMTRE